MQSDSDAFLDAVYHDWKGSAAHNPLVKAFYQRIKRECPETVFHGTDVGRQYETTGRRYLSYPQDNGLQKSEQYRMTLDNIEQGKYYYEQNDEAYRENRMVENFACAMDALEGESIMGIYGAYHIGIETSAHMTQPAPTMASQLLARYGDALHIEDLTSMESNTEPELTDTSTTAETEYKAAAMEKKQRSFV